MTPDPGVIETNVQPSKSWRETVDITLGLYEDAAKTGLGADKFLIDGRHTGTGGGNHVVVGGNTPQDCPSCGDPTCSRALCSTGSGIPRSPTFSPACLSARPAKRRGLTRRGTTASMSSRSRWRMCRREAVSIPLWLVDRLFRHILVDITGNTHRAEICIDKLFSPDSPTGRLGLVEFRALEMPPDPRMSLAQQLLVRALIAKLWREPQHGKFVRWGTALHDRFMLPHFSGRTFLTC